MIGQRLRQGRPSSVVSQFLHIDLGNQTIHPVTQLATSTHLAQRKGIRTNQLELDLMERI